MSVDIKALGKVGLMLNVHKDQLPAVLDVLPALLASASWN